jgi:hypothetical protein
MHGVGALSNPGSELIVPYSAAELLRVYATVLTATFST